jgi:DNA gyrase/topoisomerase IV subunit A
MSEREQAELRLPLLAAIDTVLRRPQEVLELLLAAEDDGSALAALRQTFGFSESQASVVRDVQWRRFTAAHRRAISDELSAVLDTLAE